MDVIEVATCIDRVVSRLQARSEACVCADRYGVFGADMYGMLLGGAGVSQSIRNFVERTLLFSNRFVYYGVPNS